MEILCISLLPNPDRLHSHIEMTILDALRVRNHNISYYYCGGLDGICDNILQSGDKNYCASCRQKAFSRIKDFGFEPKVLLEDETGEERERIAKWTYSLQDSELEHAEYLDYPIGQWCISSFNTYWRKNTLSLNNKNETNWFRSLLQNGLRIALATENIFNEKQYDVLFIYNGRMAYAQIPFQLAKRRNINAYVHERGSLSTNCALWFNEKNQFQKVQKTWDIWKNIPLKKENIELISKYLAKRMQGDELTLNWYAFSQYTGKQEEIKKRYGLKKDEVVWTLFPSSTHEIVSNQRRYKAGYPTQEEWIEDIPYLETNDYVRRVMGNYGVYEMLARYRKKAPSPKPVSRDSSLDISISELGEALLKEKGKGSSNAVQE